METTTILLWYNWKNVIFPIILLYFQNINIIDNAMRKSQHKWNEIVHSNLHIFIFHVSQLLKSFFFFFQHPKLGIFRHLLYDDFLKTVSVTLTNMYRKRIDVIILHSMMKHLAYGCTKCLKLTLIKLHFSML